MLKINMDEVQDFIVATNQITIPAAYFTQPINRALSLHVRPKTRSSKFYRKEVALPCPAQTWAQMDSRFPGPDSKLGISRAVPCASNQLWGKVLPTRRTATMETTAFSLTAARLTAINDFFRPSLTAQYGQAAAGAARLIRPGRRARKAGARATSIAQAVGPLGIKYTTPVSAAARKAGRVGKLRLRQLRAKPAGASADALAAATFTAAVAAAARPPAAAADAACAAAGAVRARLPGPSRTHSWMV